MYRVFDAHHRADLSISDDGIRNDVATQALGDRADPHLLNTEDEATEDESGERIAPSPQAVARQGLFVATLRSSACMWPPAMPFRGGAGAEGLGCSAPSHQRW
jgi:hypothetical protein